jgi:multidrug transporter EmrE-like cation transporter
MKTILKLEELAMAATAIYFLSSHTLDLPIWLWVILFFAPDISMLGYLINTKTGAVSYNLFHHKGIAILLTATGYFLQQELLISIGILLFAHAAFDRIWGYGLKYSDSFSNTHLGRIGKQK